LEYVYSNLSRNNEFWKGDEIENRLSLIKKKCKETSGRKMQKNAEPIREAVVNLNAHHSMKDLKKLAEDLKAKKGLDCFQIFIHRDEGKSQEDLNYHAHMLFDWQDQTTGKMKRLNRLDMSQLQTIVAESLVMERGELKENSNRERLEPVEYKRQQEDLKLQALQNQIMILEQKKNRAAKANQKARTENKRTQSQYKRSKRLSAQWASQGIPEYSSSLRSENKTLDRAIELQRRAVEEYLGEQENLRNEFGRYKKSSEYREYVELKKAIQGLVSEQTTASRIKARISKLRREINDAEKG